LLSHFAWLRRPVFKLSDDDQDDELEAPDVRGEETKKAQVLLSKSVAQSGQGWRRDMDAAAR
jgi:hypothetical protein